MDLPHQYICSADKSKMIDSKAESLTHKKALKQKA